MLIKNFDLLEFANSFADISKEILKKKFQNSFDVEKKPDGSYVTNIDKEITSKDIGKIVMNELLSLDHVAYLRFASVYLNFENKDAYKEIIDNLEKDLSPEMKKLQKKLLDDD